MCPFIGFHVDLRAIIKSRCCECIIYNFSTSHWQKVSDFAKYTCIFYKFLIEFLGMGFECPYNLVHLCPFLISYRNLEVRFCFFWLKNTIA